MTNTISLCVTVDRLLPETPRVQPHQTPGYALAAWIHVDEFSLWGYDPVAFRHVAKALTDAAALLETKTATADVEDATVTA